MYLREPELQQFTQDLVADMEALELQVRETSSLVRHLIAALLVFNATIGILSFAALYSSVRRRRGRP